jgi:hypothetical protein
MRGKDRLLRQSFGNDIIACEATLEVDLRDAAFDVPQTLLLGSDCLFGLGRLQQKNAPTFGRRDRILKQEAETDDLIQFLRRVKVNRNSQGASRLICQLRTDGACVVKRAVKQAWAVDIRQYRGSACRVGRIDKVRPQAGLQTHFLRDRSQM